MAENVIPQTDMGRISRNIERMAQGGASADELEAYLQSEGMTPRQAVQGGRNPMSLGERAYDAAVSGPVGVAEGAIGLAGLPGDVQQFARQGFEKMAGRPLPNMPSARLPTGQDIQGAVEQWTGPFHESQTPEGYALRALGQNAVGALAPGSPMRRIMGGVVGPTVGSEVGGYVAKDTPMETPARMLGGMGGAGLGSLATTATNYARAGAEGMPRGTSRVLEKTLTPDAEGNLARLGPEAMLLEATPGTFGVAQGVVTRPGAGQSALVDALTVRKEGANKRLTNDLNRTLGPASTPSLVEQSLAEQRKVVAKDYNAATFQQQSIDARPVVKKLDAEINLEAGAPRKTLQEIKSYLYNQQRYKDANDEWATRSVLKTSAAELLNVRQAIDDLISRTTEPNALRSATMFRAEVDKLMPRSVKDVDAKFSELMKQSEALQTGGQVLATGKEAKRPIELLQILKDMTPAQKNLLGVGTRAEIDRLVGTKANDVTALKQLVQSEGDWNRQKLAAVFGQSKADDIIKSIDREAAFQDAYRKLVENSQTAQRLGGAKLVEENTDRGRWSWGGAANMPLRAAQAGYDRVADALMAGQRAKADDVLGQLLTQSGGQRDDIVRNIRAAQNFRNKSGTTTRDELIRALTAAGVAGTNNRK